MKKIVYLLLGILWVLTVSACAGASESPETSKEIQQEVQVTSEPEKEVQNASEAVEQQEQTVENAEAFEGVWNRTEEVSGCAAQIEITEQNEEGFTFCGDFYYYSHSGYLEGKASFTAPNVAIWEYTPDYMPDESAEETESQQYMKFEKTEEGLIVSASAASSELGLGMNVFTDGLYIQGEPVYTNATVLEDNFTAQQQEALKELLGTEYDECFKTVVEEGVLFSAPVVLEDGTGATFYEAFWPTMGGYAFELLVCENGDLYFNTEYEPVAWATNVEGATDYPVYTPEE